MRISCEQYIGRPNGLANNNIYPSQVMRGRLGYVHKSPKVSFRLSKCKTGNSASRWVYNVRLTQCSYSQSKEFYGAFAASPDAFKFFVSFNWPLSVNGCCIHESIACLCTPAVA